MGRDDPVTSERTKKSEVYGYIDARIAAITWKHQTNPRDSLFPDRRGCDPRCPVAHETSAPGWAARFTWQTNPVYNSEKTIRIGTRWTPSIINSSLSISLYYIYSIHVYSVLCIFYYFIFSLLLWTILTLMIDLSRDTTHQSPFLSSFTSHYPQFNC